MRESGAYILHSTELMHCSGPVLFGRIARHRHCHRFVSLDSREKRTVRIAFESEERVRGPATFSVPLLISRVLYSTAYKHTARIYIHQQISFIVSLCHCDNCTALVKSSTTVASAKKSVVHKLESTRS